MARTLTDIIVTLEFNDQDFVTQRTHEMNPAVLDPAANAEALAVAYEAISDAAIRRVIVSEVYTDNTIGPAAGAVVQRMAKLSVNLQTPGKKAPFFIPGVSETSVGGALRTGRSLNLANPELLALLAQFQDGSNMLISDGEDLDATNLIADGEVVIKRSNSRTI